jgi:hypothetical protein
MYNINSRFIRIKTVCNLELLDTYLVVFLAAAVAFLGAGEAVTSPVPQQPQVQFLQHRCLWQHITKPVTNMPKIPMPLKVKMVKRIAISKITPPTISLQWVDKHAVTLQLFFFSIFLSKISV